MEEKVLIKSQIDKNVKNALTMIPCVLLFFSALIFIILAIVEPLDSWYNYYHPYYNNGYDAAFDGHGGCLTFFIFACVFFLFAIITLIFYWAHCKCELSITDKNVKGKTIFGKEVVLPLYMVSAYFHYSLFTSV